MSAADKPAFDWTLPALGVLLVGFVAFKWQHLALPYYWDEAFPYSFAIRHQVENGLSLLPGGMPELLYTGHPPLFYFLEAAWTKLFGNLTEVFKIAE